MLCRPDRRCLSAFAMFVVVSLLMVFGSTLVWDDAVLREIGDTRTPGITNLMLLATMLGDGVIEAPFALGVMVLLWRLRRGQAAKRYALAALSGWALYALAKAAFQRERPSIITRLHDAGWYSYPSGHAMLAPLVWSFALILLAESVTSRAARISMMILAVLIPIAIAISRVYLGVHYPSDVLGALLLGTAWMLLWRAVPPPGESASSTNRSGGVRSP